MSAPPARARGRGRGRGLLRPFPASAPSTSTPPTAPPTATATASNPSPPVRGANPAPPPPAPDFTRPLPPPRPLGTLRDPPANAPFRPGAAGSGSGSMPRRPEDVRTGVSKLKFMPKLPTSRPKKESEDIKPATPPATRGTFDRGRGRARGAAPGAGRGELQMTASGPFALGPSALLASSRPRPTRGPGSAGPVPLDGPSVPGPGGGPGGLGLGGRKPAMVVADLEQYSDEDVEIVDLDQVETLDDMAPSSLKRMKVLKPKERRADGEVEKPLPGVDKGKAKLEPEDDASASLHSSARPTTEPETPPEEEKNAANALHLSESEDEEEAEDMLDDFMARGETVPPDLDPTRERFYFFQFPAPFPSFLPPPSQVVDVDVEMADADAATAAAAAAAAATAVGSSADHAGEKRVTFLEEVKLDQEPRERKTSTGAAKGRPPMVDGVIGRMELYRDGRVKIVLGENIAMEVHPAAETAFLENVVHLDPSTKQMTALGPVERRFVVSPDLDALLGELEAEEKLKREGNPLDRLIKME